MVRKLSNQRIGYSRVTKINPSIMPLLNNDVKRTPFLTGTKFSTEPGDGFSTESGNQDDGHDGDISEQQPMSEEKNIF